MPNWDHLLTDTITYALRNGVDANGSPAFAAQATCAGRYEQDATVERKFSGEWVSHDLLATSTDLPRGTRVWPPGFATGDSNAALSVKRQKSSTSPLSGNTLYEAVL